jgi:hypothetical protein
MFNCSVFSAWEQFDLVSPNNHFGAALCGTATDVYMVGSDTSNNAVKYHFDGSTWQYLGTMPILNPQRCWLDPQGDLKASGTSGIIEGIGGGVTSFSSITTQSTIFRGGTSTDAGDTWAVGDLGLIARRPASGTWSSSTGPGNNSLRAIDGPSGSELWALGSASSSLSGFLWNGQQWTAQSAPMAGFGPSSVVDTIFVRSPNEVFFGGVNVSGPVIVRASR